MAPGHRSLHMGGFASLSRFYKSARFCAPALPPNGASAIHMLQQRVASSLNKEIDVCIHWTGKLYRSDLFEMVC